MTNTCFESPKLWLIAAAFVLIMVFSLTLPALASAQTGSSSTFTLGYGGTQFNTFNQFNNPLGPSQEIALGIYDMLVHYNSNYDPVVPDLAYKWTVFPNQSAAVFYLVDNATWSDGQPVTAQDVVYSYELANNSASTYQGNVAGITSIQAVGNYEVIFHYHPTLLFLADAAAVIPIMPKHVWEKYVPNPYNSTQLTNYTDYPVVSSGPYTVSNYVQGQYIELTANPNYFYVAMRPHVQHIVIQFFSESSTMVTALEDGQIDAAAPVITPTEAGSLAGFSQITVSNTPGLQIWYIGVNVNPAGSGNPTLKNVDVRRALAHAINYTALTDAIWGQYATPAAGLLPKGWKYYDASLSPYSYNTTLSNQLLNKAGLPMGSGGYRTYPNGTALSYTLYTVSDAPEEAQAANLIASYWKAIGIQAKVSVVDSGTLAGIIWPNFTQDFDLWDWIYTSPATPVLLQVMTSSAIATEASDSGFSNSTYDALYNQMVSTTNQSQLTADAMQLQEILYQQVPYIDLYYVNAVQAFNNQLFTGYATNMTGGAFSDNNWITYVSLRPVSSSQSGSSSQTSSAVTSSSSSYSTTAASSDTIFIVAAVVIVILVITGAILLMRKRGPT